MGLRLAGVPHRPGGVTAALNILASTTEGRSLNHKSGNA
jgi:hypothetical protein